MRSPLKAPAALLLAVVLSTPAGARPTSDQTGGFGNMTGSRSGIFGNLRKDPLRMEWRNFFEEDELNRAYQIVEVEQRDETDNDCSNESMGSDSNPSEDNFDEDEIYRKVYKVDNPEAFLEEKKQKEQEFIEKVQKEKIS